MASLFEYEKEAIRIKARRVDRGQEEQRKFSVDPNITSFEVWYCCFYGFYVSFFSSGVAKHSMQSFRAATNRHQHQLPVSGTWRGRLASDAL